MTETAGKIEAIAKRIAALVAAYPEGVPVAELETEVRRITPLPILCARA